MPQKSMCSAGSRRNSATVLYHTAQASCGHVCRPCSRASSMMFCMNMPTSAHWSCAHAAVDREEQRDRRAEELVVARELPQARGLVLARDADRRVQILAALEAPRAIRLVQVRRIDVVLGAFAHRLRAHASRGSMPRNSASGAPVSTCTRHGCRLPPDGARFAASRISTTMCFGTGVARKARQLMRLSMASETCMA